MIFSKPIKYLNYILLSGHSKGHGIHSPFVYDLVSRVFRNTVNPEAVAGIEKIRRKMLNDKRIIQVRDLGSGSGLRTISRKVSEIARYSPVPQKYGKLLSKLSAEFGKTTIIELGTSLGISTMYLSALCPEATVLTIEGCPQTAAIARQNFSEAGYNKIEILEGSFDEILPVFFSMGITPDLVFIDGNHRKEPLLKYFDLLSEQSDSKTVIIVDDINHSSEMEEAWSELKLHTKVTVSIDIYRMGILFFREGINHCDFTIRY
jgi:predicted O-methyltransferase YrrM